ncbi:sigma-70 family RNA polymerase sigma factor [Nocardioides caricicola]|uniref:Sigma-70 family RNA polymerase sigma factor n=1 Tax=Nocardioides caricicola TaxID=634770 RepID=A0ABW0N0E1_9ACTN
MTETTGGRFGNVHNHTNATESVGEQPTDPAHLAEEHVPLVGHLVRELSARIPASVDRDDLRSAGLVALVKAAQAFDPALGVPFASYAATRVRGALLDELRAIDWATRGVRRRSRDIDATRHELASTTGAFPDDATVAESLGLTTADVARTDADVSRATVLSLHGFDYSIADVLASAAPGPEALADRAEQLGYLAAAIQELPERLRAVVTGYFLEERPMREIAQELGVTESRISQLRAEALVLLRDALTNAFEPHRTEPAQPRSRLAARRSAAYVAAVAERHSMRRPARHLVPAEVEWSA